MTAQALRLTRRVVLICAFPGFCAGQGVLYQDEFEDGVIDGDLSIRGYALEENGSSAPVSELSAVEVDGGLKISGTGTSVIVHRL